MILIVARNTKIPLLTQKRKESDTYVVDESEIRQLIGNATSECHPYTYNRFSGSRAFLTRSFNSPGWQGISRDAIPIRDDREMVKKIAADAYGIGYCSAAFYDPELVTSLGLRVKNVTRFFPPSLTIDHKRIDRILYPAGLGADAWPLLRNLYVVCSGHAWDVTGGGMAFGNVMFSPQGNGQQALRYSYLYCGNYFCY